MLATAFAEALAAAVIYAMLHELLHAVAAFAVGAHPRLALSRDGLIPSPSIYVEDKEVSARERLLILYAPYVLNILLFVLHAVPLPLRLIALLTFPNALLETEQRRPARLAAAAALLLVAASAAPALLA